MFDIPDLPPYKEEDPDAPDTSLDIHSNAMFSLCNERLVADKLGASHLNVLSFGQPVFNDLELARVGENNWAHALINVSFPALDTLPLADILSLRSDLPEAFTAFSEAVLKEAKTVQIDGAHDSPAVQALERRISLAAEKLSSDLKDAMAHSAYLGKRILGKTLTFVLGTAGALGEYSSTASFLAGGGTLWDLVDLISRYHAVRLRVRKDSMFFAAELLRRGENEKRTRGVTLL